nr:YjbH domain-containing protein [Alphaproteobacteria bacterium]
DGLEASGFRVESLELSRGAARVYLSAAGGRRANDHTNDRAGDWAAAQLIADHAPMQVSSVEVVRLVAGVEATRVILRRGGPSQSARSAPDTHNAPDGLTAGPEAARVGAAGGAGGLGAAGGSFIADLTDNEKNALALRIFADLEAADFTVDKFEITRRKATVFLTPTKFREHARNVGRASRVIANHAPGSVEEIEVVTMNAGLETARVKILRKDLEAAVQQRGSAEEIWGRTEVSGPRASPPFDRLRRGEDRGGEGPGGDGGALSAITNPRRYPTLGWDVRPALRSHIGGPDALYLYQIWLAMSGSAELYRGLFVDTTVGKNITTTLDQITLDSDSQLPHVRSDLRRYAQEGEDGNIVRLQAEYLFQPAEDIFARVSAGLFEEMFGGVGGELLYRPYGSRLALGVELNRVRQRDYDQRLDFLDYEVTTGHMNVYYKMPYMGLTGEIHAGQFLAGDRGAQFALLREFNSGIAVGAWATFTNVSAEEFGEGSFDKGIFLYIPFEAFLTTSSLRGGSLSFRPLTRDGGQILNMQRRLYGATEGGNLNNVAHNWNRFLD